MIIVIVNFVLVILGALSGDNTSSVSQVINPASGFAEKSG